MGTIINYPRKIDKNQKCFRKLIRLQLIKINEKKKCFRQSMNNAHLQVCLQIHIMAFAL